MFLSPEVYIIKKNVHTYATNEKGSNGNVLIKGTVKEKFSTVISYWL